MARLNEPPAPTESFDSLKRRFIRQNRDLARHNSQQSLKIRLLEAELARLRAENIAVCEENIQLHTQMDDLLKDRIPAMPAGFVAEQETIQKQLEEKIKDFGNLVVQLKEANSRSRTGGERKRRRRSEVLAATNVEVLSPGARRLRRVVEQGDAEMAQQGQMELEEHMPLILEDKIYPRRTLESSELQQLIMQAANSESPDLGPPPTTFFDCEQPASTQEDPATSADMSSISLGRRRRSAAMRQSDLANATQAEDLTVDAETTESILKRTSTKRKWEPQEQRGDKSQAFEPRDDARRSKRDGTKLIQRMSSDDLGRPLGPAAATAQRQSVRKVLASKPVNNDPVVSPRKPSLAAKKDKPTIPARPDYDAEQTAPLARSTRQPKNSRMLKAMAIPRDAPEELAVSSVEIKLEPKTPGLVLEDVFSPPDSRPLDAGSARAETPPPAMATGGIEGPTGIRGSRRARAHVSYAEPSLNSKMRRAGEKMDAVAGSSRHSLSTDYRERSTSAQAEAPPATKDKVFSLSQKNDPLFQSAGDAAGGQAQKLGDGNRLGAATDIHDLDNSSIQPETATVSLKPGRRRISHKPSEPAKTATLRTLDAADIFDVGESPSSMSSSLLDESSVLKPSASTLALARPTGRRQTLASRTASVDALRANSVGDDVDPVESGRKGDAMTRAERVAARRRSMML